MKAIALISGGLDSSLAAGFIKRLGIEVVGLHCHIPFYPRPKKQVLSAQEYVRRIGTDLDIEMKTVDPGEDFLEMVKNPKFGYGSNINPCIDCRIFMLRKAAVLMEMEGARFVVTGEVLHQRGMSQHREAFQNIDKESGLEGFIVRPLSAKLLPQTIPEKEKWLDRDDLLGWSGRTRKPQIRLAEELGIREYPNPAGGCLLTDVGFSRRMKDLIVAGGFRMDDVELLKWGRHFRVSPQAKLVVGRDRMENEQIAGLAREGDYLFMPIEEAAGPTVLGRGEINGRFIELACKLTCFYCDNSGTINPMDIVYMRLPDLREFRLAVSPLDSREVGRMRL
ncbi:MAG: tRNA 4-thiouridine(8) synthase ThiI [Candidatus Omnitrophica bacterium]|nr:tRNA 4-thiouridine(8) synthase ThiI [Candidatus Omnitrophota bacterium]